MKKTSAILGVLAALAISALPAFAATYSFNTTAPGVLTGTAGLPIGSYSFVCSSPVHTGDRAAVDPNTISTVLASPHDYGAGSVFNIGGDNYEADITSISTGSNISIGDYFIDTISCNQSTLVFTSLTCSPSTIAHGTIGSFPSCTISCTSGYTLSAGACVASGGGSSSSPSSTYTLMGITLATGTAAMFLANAASTVSDPGLLEVVALAVGIPLAFYIIHQIIGLLPKGRTGRRS